MIDQLTIFAASCGSNSFLGFPKWYKYLPQEDLRGQNTPLGNVDVCNVKMDSITDIGPILAAVVEILLRISVLVAIGFLIYGGVKFITSQGEPDKTKQALGTVINSLVGMVIAIISTALISFIGNRFK